MPCLPEGVRDQLRPVLLRFMFHSESLSTSLKWEKVQPIQKRSRAAKKAALEIHDSDHLLSLELDWRVEGVQPDRLQGELDVR